MERRYSEVYWKIYDAVEKHHPRVISNRGGARSTKTYSTLQFLNDLIPACDHAGDVTSVVSETLPHLKKGAIRDFESIIGHPLKADARWSESEHTYTYPCGGKLEFFSVDNAGKVHGPQRKRLFVNEANHVKHETYRQLAIRTSGLILIDYNPTSSFWAIERVETLPTTVCINSTYKDNPFLSREQVAEIESNRTDAAWWRVYGEGKVGTLEGLIFPDFELVDELPQGGADAYGMDFGFSADPTALIHERIFTNKREIWLDECIYQRGMLNADIAAAMQREGVPKTAPVYCDAAEPKTIEELHRTYGYNTLACYKATRKAEQLQEMRGWRIHITKRSLNLIREARGYTWAKDRDGNDLNEPIAINDHAMDAARYGFFTWYVQGRGKGQYTIR